MLFFVPSSIGSCCFLLLVACLLAWCLSRIVRCLPAHMAARISLDVVTTLSHRLNLVRVSKDRHEAAFRFILQQMFFPRSCELAAPLDLQEQQRVFSYTETQDEVSLLLDDASLASFPPSIRDDVTTNNSDECWRAIHVYEGSDAIGSSSASDTST